MALVDVKCPFCERIDAVKKQGAVRLDTGVTAVSHAVVFSSVITLIAPADPVRKSNLLILQ